MAPLVTAREKRARELSRAVENERTSRLLSQLTKEAARFMEEAASEEEIVLPPSGPGHEPAPALAIIPAAMEMPQGAQKTVTIMAAREGAGLNEEVALSLEPPGVVAVEPAKVILTLNKRRDDIVSATARITAGQTLGATMLNARMGQRTADSAIEVVLPPPVPAPVAPAGLEFERRKYSLRPGKPKAIIVRAPLGPYSEGTTLRMRSDNRAIVVLDGGQADLVYRADRLAL